ncbi:MAG: N-acetyltransferase [Ilumatobacteraceae bacterium]|nr:N-acetyltransferase [Ilumatobacteraceae bacterium]
MSKVISHEPDASRYVIHIDDLLVAAADYRINGNAISFNHTHTQPTHRGLGLAGDLVEFAINDVEVNSSRRVVPMCWYVAEWFEKHPERQELLSR